MRVLLVALLAAISYAQTESTNNGGVNEKIWVEDTIGENVFTGCYIKTEETVNGKPVWRSESEDITLSFGEVWTFERNDNTNTLMLEAIVIGSVAGDAPSNGNMWIYISDGRLVRTVQSLNIDLDGSKCNLVPTNEQNNALSDNGNVISCDDTRDCNGNGISRVDDLSLSTCTCECTRGFYGNTCEHAIDTDNCICGHFTVTKGRFESLATP